MIMDAGHIDGRYPPSSVLHRPAWVREAYQRIVLISHRRHLDGLDLDDPTTLIVSTDWLSWRRAHKRGAHCLHFEHLLGDWPAERGDPSSTHARACRWMEVDGRDVTELDGISLGRQFDRDVSLFCNAWERLWHGLDRLCARYRPRELVLIDIRGEMDLIDVPVKRQLVADLAGRHGAVLTERLDSVPAGDPGLPERIDDYGVPAPESGWRHRLRRLYSVAIDLLSRGRRPEILFLHNWATIRSMVRSYESKRVAPAIFAAHMPKSPAFLRDCLRRGIHLVHVPEPGLDKTEARTVAAMAATLTDAWNREPAFGVEAAKRQFITGRILSSGWLEQRARVTKGYRNLFRPGHPFVRVVIGDATNTFCRTLADAAHRAGIPVDELWNGMFLTTQRVGCRSPDPSVRSCVDRLLSWGSLNEGALRMTQTELPTVRTGYPALDALRAPRQPFRSLDRALILPIYADCDDSAALTSNIFSWMIDTVRTLRIAGSREIRVKLHAGPQNLAYYQDVLRDEGLEVEILKGGALDPHIAWADVVVGPVNSGAFVETMAAGKPYYAIRAEPTLIDADLVNVEGLITALPQLADMLAKRQAVDGEDLLARWCSFDAYPDAGRRTWQVLEHSLDEFQVE